MDIFLIQDIITIINDIVNNKYKPQTGGFKERKEVNKLAEEAAESAMESLPNEEPISKEKKELNIEDYIILALKILLVIVFLFTAPIVPFIALSYLTYKRLKQKFLTDEEDDDDEEAEA